MPSSQLSNLVDGWERPFSSMFTNAGHAIAATFSAMIQFAAKDPLEASAIVVASLMLIRAYEYLVETLGDRLRGTPARVIAHLRESLARTIELIHTSEPLMKASAFEAARNCASVAGRIVERRHPHLREAWLGELEPRPGHQLTAANALMTSAGYLLAAVRIRLQNTWAARVSYRLLNSVLKSRSRTRVVINMALGLLALRIYLDQGFDISVGDVVAFPILWGALDNGATWLRERYFPPEPTQRKGEGEGEPKAQ